MNLSLHGRFLTTLLASAVLTSVAAFALPVHHAIRPHSAVVHSRVIAHGVRGGNSDFQCPPTYDACLSITATSPFSIEDCVSSSGNCSSGLIGMWTWTADVTKLDNSRKAKDVRAVWSPDPGNPSTLTISTKAEKSKRAKVVASVKLSTCSASMGCMDLGLIGITN